MRMITKMIKMNASFLFTVLTLTAIVSVYYSLMLLDNIVQVSLYNYGVEFSYDWANPYWVTLRIVQGLLGLIAIVTVVYAIYSYRTQPRADTNMQKIPRIEPELKTSRTEIDARITRSELDRRKQKVDAKKTGVAMPLRERSNEYAPTIEQQLSDIPPGMVSCRHCGKIFTQPLRMLDFHEDRPRMVSICPFCNEVIQTTPRIA